MTSTRFPGKVIADLCGEPMLAREVARIRQATRVDEVVVATTTNRDDDAVVAVADACGARWFRGSEHDVLGRMASAAREAAADLVVRVSGDCPLIDPTVIDRAVEVLEKRGKELDFVTTEPPTTFPKGLDVEALYRDVLDRVDRMASSSAAREHVTFFIYEEAPTLFRCFTLVDDEDNSDQRWTVDTIEDLQLVRTVFADLELARANTSYKAILSYMRSRPALRAINAHVVQRDPRSGA